MFFLTMPASTEALKQDLDGLTPKQLQQVADFVAFLKFRSQRHQRIIPDRNQLAASFAEFAEFAVEDRDLAEADISDYTAML
jgi:hypothetical protein